VTVQECWQGVKQIDEDKRQNQWADDGAEINQHCQEQCCPGEANNHLKS
jgi:hypothetical protein